MKACLGSSFGAPYFASGEIPDWAHNKLGAFIFRPLEHLEEKVKSRLRLAKKAMALRNYKRARENFEWVLQRKPNDLAALVGLRWAAAREF